MTERKQKRNILLTLLPVLLLAWIIFSLSAQTAESSGKTSGRLTELVGTVFRIESPQLLEKMDSDIRQMAHFAEYCAFGFFLRLHLLTWQAVKGRAGWNGLPLCLMIGVLYAVSDELHQTFVPGRSAQGIDILMDSLGVLVGCLLLKALVGWLSQTAGKKRRVP